MVITNLSSQDRVDDLIYRHIGKLEKGEYKPAIDRPFFVAERSKVIKQHQRWKYSLPDIQPYYAVKCNSDVNLLQILNRLGVNFDCASLEEIQLVLDLGVHPSRIIFAHPCKSISALRFASQRGVRVTTFDNIDELDKIKAHSPDMGLLLRIFAQDEGAMVCLGSKFGAPWDTTGILLKRAKVLGLRVVGVSFHIGSGASDPQAFTTAVQQAKHVFHQGDKLGFCMSILDVGGGFQDTNFEPMAAGLRVALEREFSGMPARLIAEPGRFYASGFYTMVCRVISRRKQLGEAGARATSDMLYQNDGVYGCFSNKWAENCVFTPILLSPSANVERECHRAEGEHRYSVWGPTCDSLDLVAEEVALNCEVKVGDWLKYRDMGAYTTSTSSRFNGFPNSYTVIYYDN